MAFRPEKLTMKSQEAVQKAPGAGAQRGHQRVEPMHLLAALLDPDQPVVRDLLKQLGVDPDRIARAAEEGLNALPKVCGGEMHDQPRPRPRPRRRPRPRPRRWATSTSPSSTCCSA